MLKSSTEGNPLQKEGITLRFPRNTFTSGVLLIAMSLGNSLCAFAQASTTDKDPPRELVLKKNQKIDFLYHASEAYLTAGTGFDMMTTANGLGHPTTASSTSGVFLTHYYAEETGWARIAGPRDTSGVILANVALNLGIDLLDRKLYKRGGKWRAVATSLNVLKGTSNVVAAVNNIRTNEGIDKVVQMQTGYTGRIVWSK